MADYRAMAAECRAKAADAQGQRAVQLRDCARTFMRLALRQALADHSQQVGRRQVTAASFREHLRATRACP
ncbi:MAG TPA: hypothetical protein VFG15_03285 [Amycolatopsis sp.]|nr:hypothetical protein [Amycolatopsis sp.]